ncbi:MAG TPA: hypothetical protein VF532_09315 [Candidatus Angelobacter sp.]
MDPFARNMIRGAVAYGLAMLLMFALSSAIYLHLRPVCPDRVLARAESPDKKWTAVILQRRCGEESPFLTHVNLRPASQALSVGFFSGQVKAGNAFLVEQDAAGAGLTISWTAPDSLTVTCPRCAPSFVRQTDAQLGTVRIRYELPQR